ncbi:nitroreductase family protein [Nesterenkonia alkaliphila]|uniref:NADPH-dependent oxidoreductase n=1 Tax=Nesterenkonia alkaliphila TaxID=1463631 RepID=A0A7K1UEZ3_9MICC|nr:nitroreductase family protein [Nesterenkonia alkaliphila]MVT25045.1 NADPH-dependent oxidoreductase [Nesterenkonia alkaliphila]GFZ97462.1 NADPH-dependent oxidoreductase [Nesterenkonia alkaliphila]
MTDASSTPTTTPADHLRARWGSEPGFTPEEWNPTLETMVSHRSVRRWLPADHGGEVTENQIRTIAAAAQSASTSSNKQVVSVVAVRDAQKKRALGEVGGPQQAPHISTAPVVLVWLIDTSRIRAAVQSAQVQKPQVEYTGAEYLDEILVGACDIGINAQNAVTAARSMGLGTCYLGSLRNDAERVGEILGTPAHVVPFLGLEIGHPDPQEPAGIKPRIPQSAYLHWDTYDAAVATDVRNYDQILADYFAQYGKPSSWTRGLVSRVGPKAVKVAKRHLLRRVFEKAGFGLR